MMLKRTMPAPAEPEESGPVVSGSDGSSVIVKERKPTAARMSPATMKGIEYKRIRRRPTRSMRPSAISVKMKFVTATVRDVSTGLLKPTKVKMVAEKYIS